jgi:hypothetical protein
MIIDTVIIRDGEVVVKHDQGQETGLDSVLHDCYMLGHYEKMYSLCRRLAALAVENDAHAQIGGSDDD